MSLHPIFPPQSEERKKELKEKYGTLIFQQDLYIYIYIYCRVTSIYPRGLTELLRSRLHAVPCS